MCKAGLWFIISLSGHRIDSLLGFLSLGSGVDVLKHLFGGIGAVYISYKDRECLRKYRFATVIFSVPSISESESELLLSLLSDGELYCAPVSFTCNGSIMSV